MTGLHKKDYQPAATGTLAGVRVLDLSRLVAGNMLTQVLGDFGAEVVKVEPPAGDTLRAWQTGGVQTNWKIYARNKKSLGLELRKPEARELLSKLVPSAAVARAKASRKRGSKRRPAFSGFIVRRLPIAEGSSITTRANCRRVEGFATSDQPPTCSRRSLR